MPVTYEFINKMGLTCSNMNGLRSVYCLPMKIQCVDTDDDGFLQNCDRKYCDIRCDWEPEGTIPFVYGDKIIFQLQFRDKANTDPKSPTLGWDDWVYAEIYNAETGAQITGAVELAAKSRWFVCHNGRNSYQQIEIDTGAEDFPCAFYVKFIAYDSAGEEGVEIDSRCSQTFKLVDDCMETHLVEGEYLEFDCLGNYYGQPECEDGAQSGSVSFAYRNITRIEGSIVLGQPEVETEDETTRLIDNYKFTTSTASGKNGLFLSNYMIRWYSNIFSAKNVIIDSNNKLISNFVVNYEQQEQNSAIVNFEWKENCNECF
ncbi:MAG: hypothetical protein WAT16_06960 [Saprospiraceae bacterium]|nr:hypothetical protein [Saprospiraceae bacterium]